MSKRICILGATNLKHMTMASLYTEELKKNGQKYDVIYIDRYNELEATDAENRYRFELNIRKEWPFPVKLMHYWKFRRYAIDIIKQRKYDFIIVWNEFTTFMFSDFLTKNYKGRYCVNIRDYNYNNVFFVQDRLKKAVLSSAFNTISSERFLTFLPKGNYSFVHSYNAKLLDGLEPSCSMKKEGEVIHILFIGRMSYPDSKIKTIKSLGNDERFKFSLVGAGCEECREIVDENKYKNIVIQGAFDPENTKEYLRDADIIFSLNQENDVFSDVLLPIKLYYSIVMHIPVLCYKSSYTYEYSKKAGIAIGIEEKDFDRLGDIIYEKYHSINKDDIDTLCEKEMEEIKRSQTNLKKLINETIIN